MSEVNINTIKKNRHKLTAKDAVRAKKVDYITRQMEQAFKRGHIPYCMDNEYDRARMAEWFYDNILPI